MQIDIKSLWLLSCLILLYAGPAHAQRKLDEKIALQGAREVLLQVDDTRLIRIDTWEQADVAITGTVSINANENNNAYQIRSGRQGEQLSIEAGIENEDSLPRRITVHQNGQDYVLNASDKNDAVVQQFIREKGGYDWMSQGVQKDITLQVSLPANTALKIQSKFGTVEIASVTAPVTIESKFGEVDVSIDPGAAISLTTDTQFGTVYTNLDWDFKKQASMTVIKGGNMEGTLNGGGIPLLVDAKFGNVYLRKLMD